MECKDFPKTYAIIFIILVTAAATHCAPTTPEEKSDSVESACGYLLSSIGRNTRSTKNIQGFEELNRTLKMTKDAYGKFDDCVFKLYNIKNVRHHQHALSMARNYTQSIKKASKFRDFYRRLYDLWEYVGDLRNHSMHLTDNDKQTYRSYIYEFMYGRLGQIKFELTYVMERRHANLNRTKINALRKEMPPINDSESTLRNVDQAVFFLYKHLNTELYKFLNDHKKCKGNKLCMEERRLKRIKQGRRQGSKQHKKNLHKKALNEDKKSKTKKHIRRHPKKRKSNKV